MNKQRIIISIFLLILVSTIGLYFLFNKQNKSDEITSNQNTPSQEQTAEKNNNEKQDLNIPIDKYKDRITKKPFGIYISPATSPVQPERFAGYHTGTDFEILPGEESQTVAVKAICNGTVILRQNISGYGGVVVQSCNIEDSPATILYGHIELSSVSAAVGTAVSRGDFLANLGSAFSEQTNGERKHLHLSIHKEPAVNYLGYVNFKSDLEQWLNFETIKF